MSLAEAKDNEIQRLQARVKELEENDKQLADKQQETKDLAARCVAAEEGRRRKAEEDREKMERELAERDKILCDVIREKNELKSEIERYHVELARILTGMSQDDGVKVLCIYSTCISTCSTWFS